jgi:putative peptidoglycan lipid II flippase
MSSTPDTPGPGPADEPSIAAANVAEAAADAGAREHRRIRSATILFSAATTFSRVAGLVREMATAAVFGVSSHYSAFVIANQIPNLLRSLVADSALSAAFVPAFTDLRERGEEARAWRVASAVCSIMICVLGPLTVLAMICAPWIVQPFVGNAHFDPDTVDLAVRLTRVLLPIVLILALSGVIVGILNSYDKFGAAAFAPVAWNGVILATLAGSVWFADDISTRIWIYAAGMLAGTIVQALLPTPWLRHTGGHRLTLTKAWGDPHVRAIFIRMFPVMISLGLINLQMVLSSFFAAHVDASKFVDGIDPGAGPALLDKAFRLYMLPQGIFSVAVSTVLFPVLSRFASRGDRSGFAATVDQGMRRIFVLLIPCAVFLCVFSTEVVRTLYQGGEFGSAQTTAVAGVLSAYAIGLTFNGMSLLLIRSFFAMKLTWLPTIVSVVTLVVNVGIAFATYQHGGAFAIALATSTSDAVGTILLYILLVPRTQGLGTARTVLVALGTLCASAVAVGISYAGWYFLLEPTIGHSKLASLGGVAAALAVTAPIYLWIGTRIGVLPPGFVGQTFRRRRGGTTA